MAEFKYLDQGNSEVQDKQAEAYLYTSSGTTGIAATGVIEGLVVRQTGTASGSVLIDAGACLSQASLGQGADRLINPSQKTLDVFTANPMGGLPRTDIVAFDSITTAIIAITGTPNASPTDPTVPATSVALGRLRHAASATTIPTAKIEDLRVLTTLRGVPSADAPVAGATMGTPKQTASVGTVTSGTTETRDAVLGNYVFTAVAGRRYRAIIEGMQIQSSNATEIVNVRLRNGGGSTPTAASTLVASTQVWVPGVGFGVSVALSDSFVPGAGTVTLALFLLRVAGSGTDSAASIRSLYAVDLGPA